MRIRIEDKAFATAMDLLKKAIVIIGTIAKLSVSMGNTKIEKLCWDGLNELEVGLDKINKELGG